MRFERRRARLLTNPRRLLPESLALALTLTTALESVCAVDAAKSVQASLLLKFRCSRNQRKRDPQPSPRKQFESDDQIVHDRFFGYAPAVLKGITIEENVQGHCACLCSTEKIPTEFVACPV